MNECTFCTKNPYTCGHAFDEGSCISYDSILNYTKINATKAQLGSASD